MHNYLILKVISVKELELGSRPLTQHRHDRLSPIKTLQEGFVVTDASRSCELYASVNLNTHTITYTNTELIDMMVDQGVFKNIQSRLPGQRPRHPVLAPERSAVQNLTADAV